MRWRLSGAALILGAASLFAQAAPPAAPAPSSASQVWTAQVWTWDSVKDRFHTNNPTLLAGFLNIDELKAQEITANLRPNPDFTLSADGTQIAPSHGVWQPFAGTFVSPGVSYLFERRNKRGLRYEVAKEGTAIGVAQQDDSERNLLFNLRSAFVGVLQAKAVLQAGPGQSRLLRQVLKISRDRFQAGDIAQIDLDRLELQRLQYESDVQTALVNLRTTKINLLALLNDRRPIDNFDVDGPFDFAEDTAFARRLSQASARRPPRPARCRADGAAGRKQLQAGRSQRLHRSHHRRMVHPQRLLQQSVRPEHRRRQRQHPAAHLRHAIREKSCARKSTSNAARNYAKPPRLRSTATWIPPSPLVASNITLLKPYKRQYLEQAVRVRDTILFSYQHGGASLLDFLNAESDYRTVQLNYVNLVGAYLTAAAQLNQAVGREVIQ